MVETWQGVRRVAFVPVSNRQVDNSVPSDFRELVYQRAFIDPDPTTNVDRSLKAYIHAVSSGRATLTGFVFPPVAADDADVVGAGLRSLPSLKLPFVPAIPIHGFDFAVMVLPHDFGSHRGGYAWYPGSTVNGVSFYARTALFTSPAFSARQSVGVWAMEVLHMICRFGDLYYSNPPIGRFDVMSCACGTHPSSYTKSRFGWLTASAIVNHPIGSSNEYALAAVSYPQPPPPGRATAIRLSSQTDTSFLMFEARDRTDTYESQSVVSSGIPSEGLVVYRVQDTTDVVLKASGLTVGNTYHDPDEDCDVRVEEQIPGGYRIAVTSRATVTCRRLAAKAEALQQLLQLEQDINKRKQLISALAGVWAEMRNLNCGLPAPPDGEIAAWDESVGGRLIGPRLDDVVSSDGPAGKRS